MTLRADKVLSWIVPFLLTANLGVLGWMGQNVANMAKDLAVVVFKSDYHEGRINRLDTVISTHESRITILEQKHNERDR